MSLYQFLIAVRQQDGQQLTNEDGETTSHLIGIFYRTLKIVENGIKPVYVFDGKPPEMKGSELAKRLVRREEAEKQAAELKETGTAEDVSRFERRTVRVSKEQNEEAQKLLKLMGIPFVLAPGEAEAQCAALAAADKVFASASEDMDTLTFGTPFLLRHLTASDQKKMPIAEVNLKKAMEGLEMSKDEFIDLCILLGCDYCDPIRGVGPTTALKLIQEHRSIEKIKAALASKESSKVQIPDDWPYEEVRKLFHSPDVMPPSEIDLKWGVPDVEGLVDFLVKEKGFSEDRVRNAAAKLTKGAKSTPQGRLTDFFKPKPVDPAKAAEMAKRKKAAAAADNKVKKKARK
ncbi:multifunctional nuclease RAD27 [Sugiyamaella lignohabitans]|uniref:Flap endonuclease 1 n=1 Tax=Sugiyamaella lignohabitans TaxID=796027 RepID=A0A167C4F9_9ASCO|nr:multifunctional nuclease RAD27 [Sugiyamaella lignohabitans]ANB11203.1 multifunctional nuclease RAD27 [Sugiyamaella lignohabitans]